MYIQYHTKYHAFYCVFLAPPSVAIVDQSLKGYSIGLFEISKDSVSAEELGQHADILGDSPFTTLKDIDKTQDMIMSTGHSN